jgi:hypothetical protein
MLDTLYEHLLEKPRLYQYKIVDFIMDPLPGSHFQYEESTDFLPLGKEKIGRVTKARNSELLRLKQFEL